MRLRLSQGKWAEIDDADFERVGRVKWSAKQSGRNWYAVRAVGPRGKQKRLWLHKEVLGTTKEVDHRDGDGLNNRRYNLREATSKQNGQARRSKTPGTYSRFRGVTWFARDGKWKAQIYCDGRNYHLGYFHCEIKAAKAYNEAAKRFGFLPEALNALFR